MSNKAEYAAANEINFNRVYKCFVGDWATLVRNLQRHGYLTLSKRNRFA